MQFITRLLSRHTVPSKISAQNCRAQETYEDSSTALQAKFANAVGLSTETKSKAAQYSYSAYFLIATFFFLPISLSLKSIILPIASVLIIFEQSQTLFTHLKKAWVWISVALFILVCVDCLRGEALWQEQSGLLHKYSKLLYLPILAIGLQSSRVRWYALHAFLLAIAITCLFSMLKAFGWLKIGHPDYIDDIFFSHIVTGYWVAFSAFLTAILGLQAKDKTRFLYFMLSLFFSYHVLFVNTGRTGTIIYSILVFLLLIHLVSQKAAKAILFILPLIVIAGWQSETIQSQTKLMIHEVNLCLQGKKNTSVGFRLQFHHYAQSLFAKNPIFGLGTGSFINSFRKDNPIPSWEGHLNQPHSELWLTAVEHGIIGLIAFFSLLGYLFYISTKIATFRLPLQGLILTFLAGCAWSDSWLFISSTGFFFVLFAAIGLGEWLEHSAKTQ